MHSQQSSLGSAGAPWARGFLNIEVSIEVSSAASIKILIVVSSRQSFKICPFLHKLPQDKKDQHRIFIYNKISPTALMVLGQPLHLAAFP
jgi:hypothetical protein